MRPLEPVDSADITVVIQGPLYRDLEPDRNIFTCIASIKRHLPRAEIIVSTWRHEDVSGVEADQLIVLDDPGCFVDESGNQINTNRMLHSTLLGIRSAIRPYVMKLRADHNLVSAELAVIGEPDQTASGAPVLFDRPITLTTLYIRNPERVPMLFHISDLVQFGTREAMLALWDQPLLKREDVLNKRPFRNPFGNFCGFSSAKRVAEQSLMLGAMCKHGIDVRLAHPCQVRMGNLKLWDAILRINFRVLDYREAGVSFPERFLAVDGALTSLYTAFEVEQLHTVGDRGYRRKIARVWFNQFLLSCLKPAWWVSLISMILFNSSPTFAKATRSLWRRLRKVTHPNSYRT